MTAAGAYATGTATSAAGHAAQLIRSPFPTVNGPEPAPCTSALLHGRVASAVSTRHGTALIIKVSAARQQCTIASGGWPVVRLHTARGARPVAKAFPFMRAIHRSATPFVTYGARAGERTVLLLGPGRAAYIPLLLSHEHMEGQACSRVTSVTIYPGPAALGAGKAVVLAQPLTMCGGPRTLVYMAGGLAGIQSVSRGAMPAMASGLVPATDSPSGFWYGSDGPKTMACVNPNGPPTVDPYLISDNTGNSPPSSCPDGTNGKYGGYFGEIGRFDIWKGCDNAGLGFDGTNYNAALVNLTNFGVGVGGSDYWILGGPGILGYPDFISTTNDNNLGKDQAIRANSLAGQRIMGQSGFIFMDIEQFGNGFDAGWQNVLNSACGSVNPNHTVSATQAGATFDGFRDWIKNNSPYKPGVYSSGASGTQTYEWPGIFGSKQITGTAEWTYNDNCCGGSYTLQAPGDWPSGWSVSGNGITASAQFFAGVHQGDACAMVWQWTKKDTNAQGWRLDQIDGPRFTGTCD